MTKDAIYSRVGKANEALDDVRTRDLSPAELIAYASAQAQTALAHTTLETAFDIEQILAALKNLAASNDAQRSALNRIAAAMESSGS